MLKIIAGVFLGILLFTAGTASFFYYLTSIDKGLSPFLLLLPIIMFAGGGYIFYKTSLLNMFTDKASKEINTAEANDDGFQTILEKNNRISEEWSMTVENKEKLRMLEMAEGARENAERDAQTH